MSKQTTRRKILKGSLAVAGLSVFGLPEWAFPALAEGETIVQDADCVRTSYPGFETMLEEFMSPKRMRSSTPVIGSLSPARLEEE